MPKLRASEWLLLSFFSYVGCLAFLRLPAKRAAVSMPILASAAASLTAIAKRNEHSSAAGVVRDFLPIGLTLLAFREMELFHTGTYNQALERRLLEGDNRLFERTPFAAATESLGRILPEYLELSYLLVYALPFICVGLLYRTKERRKVNCFYLVYLGGTLAAYACFPFTASRPPRIAFPDNRPPRVNTALRRLNLFLLKNGTIHTAVIPSAHVSSAMSAAFAFLLFSREKGRWATCLFTYAISVAAATVYGRYHYAYDVLAGFAVSLGAGLAGLLIRPACNQSEYPGKLIE